MPSLYITPVYQGPECRVGQGLRYISGLYEVSEVLGAGPYTSFVTRYLHDGFIGELIDTHLPDLQAMYREFPDFAITDFASAQQLLPLALQEFDANVMAMAERGDFPSRFRKSIYDGKGLAKRSVTASMVTVTPKTVVLTHQLFRLYAVNYGPDTLIATGVCLKATAEMEDRHLRQAEWMCNLLDAAGVRLTDLCGELIVLED